MIENINSGFISEKIQRALLAQQELNLLRHILNVVPGKLEDKFLKYGWKLSNCLFRLNMVLAPNEKEALSKACSFKDEKGSDKSPKQVCNNIHNFLEGIKTNKWQQEEDKKQGDEFTYKFPYFNERIKKKDKNYEDDDDNGYPQ